jgi:hypothetical protein
MQQQNRWENWVIHSIQEKRKPEVLHCTAQSPVSTVRPAVSNTLKVCSDQLNVRTDVASVSSRASRF